MQTVERWQMSNAPIFAMAACRASLDMFDEVGMDALVERSKRLTAYLEFIVEEINKTKNSCLQIITPKRIGVVRYQLWQTDTANHYIIN